MRPVLGSRSANLQPWLNPGIRPGHIPKRFEDTILE